MLRLFAGSLAVLLLACPPPGRNGPPPPPVGAGCPAASAVFLASYLTPSETDKQGHTGWVLPLLDKPVDSIENLPEYAPLDPAAAAAANLTAPPSPTVWLLAAGAAPCKATVGGFYAAPVDATPPNVTYGAELSGCPVPADPQNAEAVVLAQDEPSDCHLELPHPIATRLGEADAQKHWTRPTKATPIPPALAAVIPPHDCMAPGCETLWSFGEIDVDHRPVAWAGAIDWLTIPPNAAPDSQCSWTAETFSGFFVPGEAGKPVKVTEGQDHPLVLSSALVDHTGAKALIAQTAGEYAIYDLSSGSPSLAHHVVWLRGDAESATLDDHLGPECSAPQDVE